MDNRPGGSAGLQERAPRVLLIHLRLRRRMPRRAVRPDQARADQAHRMANSSAATRSSARWSARSPK